MVVQHNISAMTANRYYGINNSSLGKSLEKLSSGYAINRAGDNAAGLAVSEKMRAQISGLTQASKNAQDGISMVQTFEGALQETDSILQRMRTLAVQSANGSYQDDVDRDAMQLEFDQLNDELNQIADTDFNGVVVLNGGTMADGVKANALGKIDYATKKADVTKTTKANLQANVDSASQALNAAKAEFAKNKYDLSSNGDAPEWNTVDNHLYNKDTADDLWGAMGFTKDVGSNKVADTTQADTVAVTFTYDGATKTWKASSAEAYLNGENVKSFSKSDVESKFTATANNGAVGGITANANATGQGGFNVKLAATGGVKKQDGTTALDTAATSEGTLGNAIFDATSVKDGDTVTLVYKNGDSSQKAALNIGIDESTFVNDAFKKSKDGVTADKADITIKPEVVAQDTQIDASVLKGLDAIEGSSFSITYDDTAGFAKGAIKINGTDLAANKANATSADAVQIKVGDTSFYASVNGADDADPTIDLYVKNDKNDMVKVAAIGISKDPVTPTSGTDASGIAGTVSFKISTQTTKYNPASTVTITAGDDPNLGSSDLYTDKVAKADKALADADAKMKEFNKLNPENDKDWTRIKEMFSESQSSSGGIVSISDSYDQSKAKLTFADNMSLQVGARTKDIVDFKFSYSSDDLGGLEKNMNCSAREGGLNTASLSITTQQSANDAIDKIDKALNKVSMVRATFGGIQNRLEHKINNLDTNTENLTAAESRIRDTQMDQEMMKFTSSQILSQASQSMLAQANSLPQGVLQLLG